MKIQPTLTDRESFVARLEKSFQTTGGLAFRNRRHLLDTDDLTVEEIGSIMEIARLCKEYGITRRCYLDLLASSTVAGLFYENSTRTRSSFQIGAMNLGARFTNLDVSTSSIQKGETLLDSASVLVSMGVDCLILRHPVTRAYEPLVEKLPDHVSIINAGDGSHAHPTQGLLDLLSILEVHDRLQGRKVTIVGDVKHSRVARSSIKLLASMGADVHVCGPSNLIPDEIDQMAVRWHTDLDDAIAGADFVMALRLQRERMEEGLIPDLDSYTSLYRIDHDRLRKASPAVRVLHPGPLNRDVELTSTVADDEQLSLIAGQVTNGVAVRMAVLFLLLHSPG